MERQASIVVIGGGLAGSEAAWQLSRAGLPVALYEMRPETRTLAHRTEWLAELVCSNSLKSNLPLSAPGLLKEELRRAGSLLMQIADRTAVPGGQALAVDREAFARLVTQAIVSNPLIRVRREELTEVPRADNERSIVIVATGPLTSEALAGDLAQLTGSHHLYFYDAISPIVDAETINYEKAYPASRYGKGGEDYMNCPLTREEYDRFYEALRSAEEVERHPFEAVPYFEACLPIEELARRGRETLRFGPMKPVGLIDPRTGRMSYAVVQLRQEDLRASSYNLVGFQNHLKFGEQKRVLRLIPGLEQAEFLRFGQIHRNTYINAPALLTPTLQLRHQPGILFAGQLCGTEGYIEAMGTGLMAGLHVARLARGECPIPPPLETAMGSLVHYICGANPHNYQPANIAFDLLPELEPEVRARMREKKSRRFEQCRRALRALELWVEEMELPQSVPVTCDR